MADATVINAREQVEGHKALLELESEFNTKPHAAVLGIQGSQIHALTRFGRIFDIYPSPVVINAAILKLADWFRTSNNVIRIYVYKVFKRSSNVHLQMMINVDEALRRILPVLGSNDPVARSITLRVVGCLTVIFAEKLDVHHGIIQCFEQAADRVEMEAAIWAIDQICSRSLRFPSVIFPKLVAKLEKPDVPFDIQLRLIRIFRHMHRDIAIARQAKSVCLDLLARTQENTSHVVVIQRTLTLLLGEALIDRKEQMDRLLDYLGQDDREDVQQSVLYDLVLLGKNDIMFDESHLMRLIHIVATASFEPRIRWRAYNCVDTLIWSYRQRVQHILNTSERDSWVQTTCLYEKHLEMYVNQNQIPLVIAVSRLFWTILRIGLEEEKSTDAMDIDTASTTVVFEQLGHRVLQRVERISLSTLDQCPKKQVHQLLRIKARLYHLLDKINTDQVFQEAFHTMTTVNASLTSSLCHFLSSMATKYRELPGWFPDAALEAMSKAMNESTRFVNLVQLFLRTEHETEERSATVLSLVRQFGQWESTDQRFCINAWQIYNMSVEAGRCRWFQLMYRLLYDLRLQVSSPVYRCWLSALTSLAEAECHRHHGTDHYLQALTHFKILGSLESPKHFQSAYVQLRMELISSIHYMLHILDTTPSEQDSQSLTKIRQMMNYGAARFQRLASCYDEMAQAFSDLKPSMMVLFEDYKICALVCEYACQSCIQQADMLVCIDPSLIPLLQANTGREFPSRYPSLQHLCQEFIKTVTGWESLDLDSTHRYQACGNDIRAFSKAVLQIPLILPSIFFHHQSHSPVKLVTDPFLTTQ